ncbi:MAG: epsH [Fibrobacteres bacterium]|nr:epsH [Fibrobacterota bacterium]
MRKSDLVKPRLLQPIAWIAFSVLLIANYFPTLKWMVERWDEPESYMAHGWLIVPISLFLLWLDREKIRRVPRSGSVLGFFVLAVAILIHLVAGMADVSSISGMTLVLALLGIVLLQFGMPMAKVVWFPIVFLLFMVPPPEFVISKMNFSLKLIAADFATGLLNLIGLPAIRQGSSMVFQNEKLAVGDVCSGLRSLLALLSLSVLYAWLVREKGRFHVSAILLMAIPAAVIGNGIRIFLVSCLVMGLGSATVFRPLVGSWDLHLFTGSVIFIAAFTCLYLAGVLMDRVQAARASRGSR